MPKFSEIIPIGFDGKKETWPDMHDCNKVSWAKSNITKDVQGWLKGSGFAETDQLGNAPLNQSDFESTKIHMKRSQVAGIDDNEEDPYGVGMAE